MSFPTTFEEALDRCLAAAEGVFPTTPTRVWEADSYGFIDTLSMTLTPNQLVDYVLRRLLTCHGNPGFTRFTKWMEFMKSIDAKWDHRKFKSIDGSYTF